MARKREPVPQIRTWDDPILSQVCEPVTPDDDVDAIIRAMCGALRKSKNGVGLAAPQIGIAKRVIVIAPNGFFVPMINPVIEGFAGIEVTRDEGCLSYPGRYIPIERPNEVCVTYQMQDGMYKYQEVFEGFVARIIQHEIDHLNGVCKVAP